MVSLEHELTQRDETMLRRLVENHVAYTGSERAEALLRNWETTLDQFVKVMPEAYERVLTEQDAEDVREQLPEAAIDTVPGNRHAAVGDD
jgi:glutamate synthase (NADPH/NADH) large chain